MGDLLYHFKVPYLQAQGECFGMIISTMDINIPSLDVAQVRWLDGDPKVKCSIG